MLSNINFLAKNKRSSNVITIKKNLFTVIEMLNLKINSKEKNIFNKNKKMNLLTK